MPRVHTVQKARKDYPGTDIKKGDTYYWWKFRYGGKHRSKKYPRPSQLTQSPFLSQLYDLQETISWDEGEDLEGKRDELVTNLEELRDECQESLDNMPEGLQESSESGQLLQERIDGLEEWISNLEAVDFEDESLRKSNLVEALDEADPGSLG